MSDLEVIFLDIVERIFELADKQFPEQREFAAAIGVTPSIVSEWRRRKSASYVKRLEKISQVLGTTPQYLLSGGTSEEDTASKESRSDAVSEDTIKAAFFEGGQDLTPAEMDELWEDAKDYIQYKLDQRRRKKK